VEINMSYFKKFPTIKYDYEKNGALRDIISIYKSIRVPKQLLDDSSLYTFYNIENGERPDIISSKLYGTPEYYWTFFIINDFLHDGMRVWPMSQELLEDYMKTEYDGFVITTNPVIVRNTDGLITEFRNSLAGRFTLGEQIVGSISGACGQLFKKSIDMNQLVVRSCQGRFIGDPSSINQPRELVVGQDSGDSVDTYRVYDYIDAPNYYYIKGDPEKRPADNGIFVRGGIPETNLEFVSNRQFLFEQNEQRSRIRVINPDVIAQFAENFKDLINA
jgi:hypothetical protein